MRPFFLLLVVAGTCLTALGQSPEDVKKELKQFQGSWKAVFIRDYDGKQATAAEAAETSLKVEGNHFIITSGTTKIEGTFTIDPTKKTKTIDVFLKDAPKDQAVLGIYQSKGDTRKSCFARPGKERPGDFNQAKDVLIVEWKRQK